MARPISQDEAIDTRSMQKLSRTISCDLLNRLADGHILAQINRESSTEDPETPGSKPLAKESHLWRLATLKRHMQDWQPGPSLVRCHLALESRSRDESHAQTPVVALGGPIPICLLIPEDALEKRQPRSRVFECDVFKNRNARAGCQSDAQRQNKSLSLQTENYFALQRDRPRRRFHDSALKK